MKTVKNAIIRGLVNLLKALEYQKRLPEAERRFLVVSTTGVGDTLWAVPALRALRETFSDAFICVLTSPVGHDVLMGNPDIDKIFVFRRGASGLAALPGLARSLRRGNFGTALVFHASDRIVWPLTFLSGAPDIIGAEGDNKGMDFIFTRKVRPSTGHHIEQRLALVNEIGAATADTALRIYPDDRERSNVDTFLTEQGVNGESLLVGLHPGAKDAFKCWPPENFIKAGSLLSQEHGYRIVITGNSMEEVLANRIASGIEGAFSAAGRLTLRETAALYEKLALLIINDTGPMHIAFAVGTPTVALFCPTDPETCGPHRARSAEVVHKPVTCAPCTRKKCSKPDCMEQISVEEVIKKAEGLLKHNARSDVIPNIVRPSQG